MLKLSQFCSKSFHCDTDRRCCVKISWNLADRKLAKSCQPPTMCSESSRFYPNRFTFGGVTAERM